jgi:hypothetical protein
MSLTASRMKCPFGPIDGAHPLTSMRVVERYRAWRKGQGGSGRDKRDRSRGYPLRPIGGVGSIMKNEAKLVPPNNFLGRRHSILAMARTR